MLPSLSGRTASIIITLCLSKLNCIIQSQCVLLVLKGFYAVFLA